MEQGKNNMSAISVIIPVYNVEKYLRACLDSVMAQTFTDLEIICVNDGSTDESRDILTEYAGKDSRIRVIDRENGGLSEARNSGAAVATGKYIYFLDSDDWIEPDAMQKCFEISEKHHLDLFIFDFEPEYESEDLRSCFEFKPSDIPYEEVALAGPELFEKQYKNSDYLVCTWLRFIRREYYLAKKLSFYPHLIHEDVLFALYCDFQAERSLYQHWKFYHYRIRKNSIMTKVLKFERFQAMAIILNEERKFMQAHPEIYDRCKTSINEFLIDIANGADTIRSKIDPLEYKTGIADDPNAKFLELLLDCQRINNGRIEKWKKIYDEMEFRADRAEEMYNNLLNSRGIRIIRFFKK